MAAVLARAAMNIRLKWSPPPCTEHLWSADWFLRLEHHTAIFRPCTLLRGARETQSQKASSILTTLDCGAAGPSTHTETVLSDQFRTMGIEGHSTDNRSGGVHLGGSGALPMAQPSGDEGCRERTLS